ncbi:hypothetical protein DPMN_184326 [Dreissena polymorpha]|uniref:Uncharacterized protein n=1 Tax=Dreissena polymorpha TaxID=45954 RepID=A0A9D4DKM9_DREPO|nr:hypothetical protein DPMN_184326 [Dreissena polymorpha]
MFMNSLEFLWLSALHAAALSGHASSVKILLNHGAQIDATDLIKHTPLFRACEMGHTDVVQTLIDDGARDGMLDEDGRSPLNWRTPIQCAAYGGYVNCMSVLLEHKADPNANDCEGMTVLHRACSKGHLDAVKLLNHMLFTEERYTPLDYALMVYYLSLQVHSTGLSTDGVLPLITGTLHWTTYTPLGYALMVYYLSFQVHFTGLWTDGLLPLISGTLHWTLCI